VIYTNAEVLVARPGRLPVVIVPFTAAAVCVAAKISFMICGCVATGNGISPDVGVVTGETEADLSQAVIINEATRTTSIMA
jgi:hypothetical protein